LPPYLVEQILVTIKEEGQARDAPVPAAVVHCSKNGEAPKKLHKYNAEVQLTLGSYACAWARRFRPSSRTPAQR